MTAEHSGCSVREATGTEVPFVQRMSYEAANRPGDDRPPLEDSMREPQSVRLCSGFSQPDVIAELPASWVTAVDAPPRGCICLVARRPVIEPFQLPVEERRAFFDEAMLVAEAVTRLVRPIKVNYEMHGNTLPHLHLHIFPRTIHDPYVWRSHRPCMATFARRPEVRSYDPTYRSVQAAAADLAPSSSPPSAPIRCFARHRQQMCRRVEP